jgi:uncharacterized membrane protein SpoIIM required for sporulation
LILTFVSSVYLGFMLVWYDFAWGYSITPPRDASLLNLSRESHPLPNEPDLP